MMKLDLLFFAHFFNGILIISMPVALAIYLLKRWKLADRIWWLGTASFVISQVGHIPFNWALGRLLNQTNMVSWDPVYQLIFNAVFIGLSAGVFEEVTRFLVLRYWAKGSRSWRSGVLFGAGHGGAEAIIIGVLVVYTFIQLVALRDADLSKVFPASQLVLAKKQVTTYWSETWFVSFLPALERLFAISIQIALAVIVLQVFTRRQLRWLFLAIGYHAIIDGLAGLIIPHYFGVYWTELVVGIFAILSLVIIFLLRQPEPSPDNPPVSIEPTIAPPQPLVETQENLEKTRYQES